MSSGTQIKDVFKNQTVFLTGGTGFLGKVLIGKLLRECQDLKRIYILIRPKKGKDLEERYRDIFEQPCFDLLKSKNVNVREKVVLVGGDCEEPMLGISKDDLEILKSETNFVIHAAANVKLDQSLTSAACNVRGTRDLVEFAKEMSNLKAFVYVSTAYSNCVESHIREKVYDPPTSVHTLLNLVDTFGEKFLERITSQLLGRWPNTYVYSKSISESLIDSAANCFPTVILRPAIVVNSVKEPVEGWCDNILLPIGITLGASFGFIRSFHAKKDAIANLVPVDYFCNCILAAIWKTVNEKCTETKVYNYTRFNDNPLRWGEYASIAKSFDCSTGFNNILWYNTFTIRENKLWNDICIFWLHTLPAYIVDGALFCLGRPTKVVRSYQKINKVLSLRSYFSTNTWTFDDANVSILWHELTEDDQKSFKFRDDYLDWEDLIGICMLGLKRFVAKEPVDGKKRVKFVTFMMIHYTLLVLFWYIVYRVLAFVLGIFL